MNNLEIKWTEEGVSVEYDRGEARVLMAVPENIGTVWTPEEHNEHIRMWPSSKITEAQGHSGILTLRDSDYRCIGCQTCYPDAPDEAKCPDCGRPLVSYPRVFVCNSNKDPEELCVVCNSPHEHITMRIDGSGKEGGGLAGHLESYRKYTEITGHFTAEELLEGAGRERCSLCKGKGERGGPDNTWRTCYRCKGKGVEPDDAETYITRDSEEQSRDQADAPELTDAMRDSIQHYMKQSCKFNCLWGWVEKTTISATRDQFYFEADMTCEQLTDNPVAELNALCDEVETRYQRHLADQVRDAVEGGTNVE